MYTPVTCTVPFTHQWHKLLATTNIAYIHVQLHQFNGKNMIGDFSKYANVDDVLNVP